MLIIADQGKEFVGTQFKELTNANSILLHTIDVRAPWKNGGTERHGDIHRRIFERARWMHSSVLWRFSAWLWNVMPPRIDCPTAQAALLSSECSGTSDDIYARDPVYDLAATDASFEESRQIREAAMKAHAEVSIRDRIEDSVRARLRT